MVYTVKRLDDGISKCFCKAFSFSAANHNAAVKLSAVFSAFRSTIAFLSSKKMLIAV